MDMATEELKVVLRRNENSGFGFSLLGTTGPPHVIYDVVENSPADCGEVEAGDVILKVNGTDVHRYTTKEVLKCLRLSDDLVTLELKRDPKLKARIKEQLANTKSPHYIEIEPSNIYDYNSSSNNSSSGSNARRRHTTSPPIGSGGAGNSNYVDDSFNKPTTLTATTSSPNTHLRYKTSPTHAFATQTTTNLRQQTSTVATTLTRVVSPTQHHHNQSQPQQQHSRNSSGSSAKIQIIETSTTTTTIPANNSNATASPTNRPSRIPQALKSVQKPPIQNSPQHKKSRPSQIPTKAGTTGTNGSEVTSPVVAPLQHSSSYTGCSTTYQQQQRRDSNERSSGGDSDPISAPPQPAKTPRFEAYMMTGDLILNLSRTPQTSNLLTGHTKKVDSLRDTSIRNVSGRNATNGALAPRASGESSPISSSSVDLPSNATTTTTSDSIRKLKQRGQQLSLQQKLLQQQQQQQQRDSINNSYNNSNNSTGDRGVGLGEERNYRKDSITNDTLRLCEEIERDDDDDDDDDENQHVEDEEYEGEYDLESHEDNNYRRRHYHHHHTSQQQRPPQSHQKQQRRYRQENYEIEEENEEDQTNYDITNIETYIAGNDDSSDRQCLMLHCGDNDDGDGSNGDGDCDDDYSTSVASATSSAKQRLRALKQRAASRHKARVGDNNTGFGDSVDCANTRAHHHHLHHNVHGSGGTNSGCSSTSSATVKSDGIHGSGCGTNTSQDETSFSVPTSPISLSTPLIDKETANSVPTSPEPSSLGGGISGVGAAGGGIVAHDSTNNVIRRHNGIVRKCDSAGFRTSKSEDHLQQIQRDGMAAVIPIDIDEDVNSSLNTLLDTRQDSEDSQASNHDRIIWTYNAPLQQLQQQQQLLAQQENIFATPAQHYVSSGHGARNNNSSPHSNSHSSSISSSPQHSAGSPASPTSVSSSVMSSSGSKGALGTGNVLTNNGGGVLNQQQQQEQQQNGNYNGANARTGGMVLSDASDSDSTILVSDAATIQRQQQQQAKQQQKSEHKLVIQVRGIDSSNSTSPRSVYSEFKDSEDELVTATLTTDDPLNTVVAAANNSAGTSNQNCANNGGKDSSPPVSDDGSDVESLHSYHYSPKAVDMPSAIRLAKRLYSLDGFKKSDVSRHLSKNNDFSRAVADEYLKYFNFEQKTLDQSLREFLQQFSLSGETQERERVLVHFSKRFLDCNPGSFNSQDAVHTLTCAIMLLNTDLHGQNIGRKMTCAEFVENLAELNDGENFPKDVLKYLYQAIKSQPLEWALDDDPADLQKQRTDNNIAGSGSTSVGAHAGIGQNPFLDLPESSTAVEYKKGYVMRKCCFDTNFKKTPFGKRSWKMFYCTLRDLVLFLHKDEHGFRKNQMSDNLHNAIRIHHALATKANDYTKKQHVFRLQTADQAEYLFQTSDSKELQSWVETINFVCAAYSAPPLEGGVGSQKRFQRPLLPSTHTKYLLKEQLESHEQQLAQLEHVLTEHKKGPVPSKGLPLQNYKEKENYLQYELRRYKAYVSILNAKMLADQQQQLLELQQQQTLTLNLNNDEQSDTFPPLSGAAVRLQNQTPQQQQQEQQQQQTNSIIAQPQQALQQQQQQQQQSSSRKKEKKDKKEKDKKEKKEKKKK